MKLILAAAMIGVAAATSTPLHRYLDHARVMVISAPKASDAELLRQQDLLRPAALGLRERDLVVIQAIGGEAQDDRGAESPAASVRRAVGLRGDRFGVVLVGKDGGVKLRRSRALSVEALFQTIDAMPMRREEMRRPKAP